MALKTSLTGSYPPTYDLARPIRYLPPDEQDRIVRESISRAVNDQIELGIDVLVDGQVRDDIVSLFARRLPGYEGDALPYRVVRRVRPSKEPMTVQDYLYAKGLAGGRPLKAHITGPMSIARASAVESGSGYASRGDPKLVRDLANALGQEALCLVEAGAEVVQIDEPVLAYGIDLDLAFEAIQRIIEVGTVPYPGLHVCGNVTRVLDDILRRCPVRMVSIEGSWMQHEELRDIDDKFLAQHEKQLGLGCIQVSDYSVEKLRHVQAFLDQMVLRLGEDNIWAVMPNCGLRSVPHHVAKNKLKVMVEAARFLEGSTWEGRPT